MHKGLKVAALLALAMLSVPAARQWRRREAALMALNLAGGSSTAQLKEAKSLFVKMTNEPAPAHWSKYVRHWAARLRAGGTLQARKPSGRPPKISNQEALTIATEWTQHGVGRGQNWRAYENMKEVRGGPRCATSARAAAAAAASACRQLSGLASMLRSPHLQAMSRHPQLRVLAQTRCLTASYLIKKCKEVCKEWRVGIPRQKKAFDCPHKRARLNYALGAVDNTMEQWQSTIFADEHVFFRRPSGAPAIMLAGRRWGGRSMCKKVRDRRLKTFSYSYPKLHFFYGVHWKLGVLGPYWVHDCKGWRKAKTYPVSPPTHPLGKRRGARSRRLHTQRRCSARSRGRRECRGGRCAPGAAGPAAVHAPAQQASARYPGGATAPPAGRGACTPHPYPCLAAPAESRCCRAMAAQSVSPHLPPLPPTCLPAVL